MGKFLIIVEHIAFDIWASFLQIPIKMGRFPSKWEDSHKNGKIPINIGKFPFIVEHVDFDKRTSFLPILIKNGNIPINMGKFP